MTKEFHHLSSLHLSLSTQFTQCSGFIVLSIKLLHSSRVAGDASLMLSVDRMQMLWSVSISGAREREWEMDLQYRLRVDGRRNHWQDWKSAVSFRRRSVVEAMSTLPADTDSHSRPTRIECEATHQACAPPSLGDRVPLQISSCGRQETLQHSYYLALQKMSFTLKRHIDMASPPGNSCSCHEVENQLICGSC